MVEYYSAEKRILPVAVKWTQLEYIMLSEISWTQKTNNTCSSIFVGTKKQNNNKIEEKVVPSAPALLQV